MIRRAAKAGALKTEDTALTVFFQRLQRRNAVCVLQDAQMDTMSSSLSFSNSKELWVFIVNGTQSGVPVSHLHGSGRRKQDPGRKLQSLMIQQSRSNFCCVDFDS